jgi:hypothetical protein
VQPAGGLLLLGTATLRGALWPFLRPVMPPSSAATTLRQLTKRAARPSSDALLVLAVSSLM